MHVKVSKPPAFESTPGPELTICKILGLVVQFWFLHAFFWMNVMSYDIYKRFRGCQVCFQRPILNFAPRGKL
jgi:hypothetical protein